MPVDDRFSPNIASFAALLIIASGCGPVGSPAAPASAHVAIVDGVKTITNSEPAWRPGEEWRVATEPETVIGVDEGAYPEMLSGVRTALVLPDGGIAVPDGSNEVRFFDANGVHRFSAGGSGQGPCEFGMIGDAYIDAAGSVAADDVNGARYALFSAAGQCLGGGSLQLGGYRYAGLVGRFGDGTLVLMADRPESWRSLTDGWTTGFLVGLDPGSNTATLEVEVRNWEGLPERLQLAAHAHAAARDDRIYYTAGRPYVVDVYDDRGSLVHRIQLEEVPPEVTDADLEAFRRKARANIDRAGGDPNALARLQNMTFASSFPGYRKLIAGPDGSLWAARDAGLADTRPFGYRMDAESRFPAPDERLWDVFDAAGTWLGQIGVRWDRWLAAVTDDHVVLAGMDADGVEHVWVHRLIKS